MTKIQYFKIITVYKTKLRELDVIHNIGLRICLGALRTTPIQSVYVNTLQLAPDPLREELELHYAAIVRSCTEKSSYKIINQTLHMTHKQTQNLSK